MLIIPHLYMALKRNLTNLATLVDVYKVGKPKIYKCMFKYPKFVTSKNIARKP